MSQEKDGMKDEHDEHRQKVKEIFNQFGGIFSDQAEQSDFDELEEAVAAALRAQAEAHKAEVERLNERFPCSHRKLDWDDSYNNCMACNLKAIAADYERLPDNVIECHDKIEELDAQLATAKAEIDALKHDIERHLNITTELLAEVSTAKPCPSCGHNVPKDHSPES